jgi:hypothetical protein
VKLSSRILIVIASFIMAIMFAIPNLVILVAILCAFISQYLSLTFCLLFAWHIAKLVEHFYKKSQE